METHNNKLPDQNNYSFFRFFIGILLIISGIVDILVSFKIIEYVDTRPNQIAIFNDPHTWEVTMLGATLLFFGIANLLPAKMKIIAIINNFLLLVSFSAVVIGVILQKIN